MKTMTWGKTLGAGLLVGAALIGNGGVAFAADPAAVQKAATWTQGQQKADGSFPGFGVGSTADAVLALVAGGQTTGVPAAVNYLASQAPAYAKTPGAAAKLILALDAAGQGSKATNFGGVNLVKVIQDNYDPATGHYGKDVTGQALVILAMVAGGEDVPAAADSWLAGAQAADGGWAFDGSKDAGKADTNTTGLALQALAGSGALAGVKARAVAYLHAQQNPDGGYAYQKGPDAASDANSTAMVIMGLRALNENPDGAAWQQGGKTPVGLLASLQNASGAFRYQASQAEDNAGATFQAIPALAGWAQPVVPGTNEGRGSGAPGGSTPGMPSTGAGPDLLPVWMALAGLALVAGGRRLRARVRLT